MHNRVKFAEVLLMVIRAENKDVEKFSYSQELRMMFIQNINPHLLHKEPD